MLREVLSSTAHKLSNLKKSGTQDTSIMSWTLRERAKLFTHEKSALHKQYKTNAPHGSIGFRTLLHDGTPQRLTCTFIYRLASVQQYDRWRKTSVATLNILLTYKSVASRSYTHSTQMISTINHLDMFTNESPNSIAYGCKCAAHSAKRLKLHASGKRWQNKFELRGSIIYWHRYGILLEFFI